MTPAETISKLLKCYNIDAHISGLHWLARFFCNIQTGIKFALVLGTRCLYWIILKQEAVSKVKMICQRTG